MINLLCLLALLAGSTCNACPSPPLQGRAVYYAPSWDWDQIAQRQGVTIPRETTPIATWDCQMLGRTGWLQLGELPPIRVTVADCTAPEHQNLVRARQIVAEVPYSLAATVPGMVADGWVPAALWLDQPEASRSAASSWTRSQPGLPLSAPRSWTWTFPPGLRCRPL